MQAFHVVSPPCVAVFRDLRYEVLSNDSKIRQHSLRATRSRSVRRRSLGPKVVAKLVAKLK